MLDMDSSRFFARQRGLSPLKRQCVRENTNRRRSVTYTPDDGTPCPRFGLPTGTRKSTRGRGRRADADHGWWQCEQHYPAGKVLRGRKVLLASAVGKQHTAWHSANRMASAVTGRRFSWDPSLHPDRPAALASLSGHPAPPGGRAHAILRFQYVQVSASTGRRGDQYKEQSGRWQDLRPVGMVV